jgi:hypothetical protein
MSLEVKSSRHPLSLIVPVCAAILLFGALAIAGQSRIIQPQSGTNTNSAAKRSRVAKMRATDSPDGSRVALTANQSLNDYEAYRRGDRFYVKIPKADVPRSEIVRGRAFADVKVDRASDGTVVSFRLQPGATARVEQHGNKLDVVFKMPGSAGVTAANPNRRESTRNDAGPAPPDDSRRRAGSNSNLSGQPNSLRGATNNSSDRTNLLAARPSPLPALKPSPSPAGSPAALAAMASPSPAARASVSPLSRSSPTPAASSVTPAQGSTLNKLKERARYYILLAQLNPLPVAIGVGVLLLLIGLLFLQRRRAKTTRRARPRKASKAKPATEIAPASAKAATVVTPASAKPATAAPGASVAVPAAAATVVGAAAATGVVAAASRNNAPEPPAATNGDRHEKVERVSEEVKKMMAGGDYDEGIIGSDDRDTRLLVGAELSSALVGRNLQRRERARAAFMKHGYFDDATRDLRTAESANERAAAARRLSFVHDREATPHLIGGLDDPAADVRRASIEALMDLRDPAAIAPLNSLMQTETDRKVPRGLIKQAIEACAVSGAQEPPAPAAAVAAPNPASQSEAEREVIEI